MIFGCPKNQIKADHIPQHGEGISNTACIFLAVLPDKKSTTTALVIDICVQQANLLHRIFRLQSLNGRLEHLLVSTVIFHQGFLIT